MKILWFAAASLILAASGWAQSSGGASRSAEVNSVYPQVQTLYVALHEHPELSGHEVNTAATVAAKLRGLGYEVTEHVGGAGVVAVLRNGAGPTVMLRTELDALPVEEKTGLAYASKVTTKNDAGLTVPVMHACGHDIHMAALVGTAEIMGKTKDQWHGTLVLIGQPADRFLGGLADQHQRPVPLIFGLPHDLRRTHQGRHVNVVAAGMHHGHRQAGIVLGRNLARVGKPGLLLDRERVQLSPQHNRRACPVAKNCHHAGSAHVLGHLIAKPAQFGGN